LRCLLPKSLLDSGFFGTSTSSAEDDNKKSASHFSSYSWSGQRKVPSYLHNNVFPQEFLSTLRTIAMQEHELEQVASLLGEVSVFTHCILKYKQPDLTSKITNWIFSKQKIHGNKRACCKVSKDTQSILCILLFL
jgi:hypothetical protein